MNVNVRARIVNMWRANFKVKEIVSRLAEKGVEVSCIARTESIGDLYDSERGLPNGRSIAIYCEESPMTTWDGLLSVPSTVN